MLINAVEAREKSIKGISKETEIKLLEIENSIVVATEKGKMSCWYYNYINEQTKNILCGLGYKVKEFSSQIDGTMYEIRW